MENTVNRVQRISIRSREMARRFSEVLVSVIFVFLIICGLLIGVYLLELDSEPVVPFGLRILYIRVLFERFVAIMAVPLFNFPRLAALSNTQAHFVV